MTDTKKTANIKKHARMRLAQRTALPVSGKTLAKIANLIIECKSEHLKKVTNRLSIHRVEFEGESLVVVYDNKRHLIVSILPKEDFRYERIDKV